MKRTFGIMLAIVMVFVGGLVTVYADDGPQKITVNIKNICTLLWVGEKPQFNVELDPSLDGIVLEDDIVSVVSEKWIDISDESYELTVGGENIAVAGGKYRYELKLSAAEGFIFDNALEGFTYHGVNGDYRLHYDFPPEGGNHTMIVRGDFDNIIATSPLKVDVGKFLAMVTSGDYSGAVDFLLGDGINTSDNVSIDKDNSWTKKISNDKYSYELVLKTEEGFHFSNKLIFDYDKETYGYTLDYKYELSDNKHTLKIKGLVEKNQAKPTGQDTSDLSPGASGIDADKAITSMTSDSDPKGTVFSKLRLRSTHQTGNSIKLSWNKQSNAKVYVIYGNKCGGSNKPKRVALSVGNTTTVKSIELNKLKKGTYYKFIIVALDGNGKVVSTSKVVHVATKGGKAGNYKGVKVSKSVISKAKKLKKGKSLKLNAKAVAQSKKLKVKKRVALRYETTNGNIATVSRSGRITAKKKGTCYIYAFAQNGVYKKIKVTVK